MGNISTISIITVGFLANIYLVGFYGCRDCIPLIAQGNYVAPWLLLAPFLLIIPVLVFYPERLLAVWLLPGSVVFVRWYLESFVRVDRPATTGIEVTTTIFNVLRTNPYSENIISVIREIDADIVTICELGPKLEAVFNVELRSLYPHQVTNVREGFEGVGLLSRYPILESEIVENPQPGHIHLDRIYYVRSVVDIQGRQVAVYNFHPPVPQVVFLIGYDDSVMSRHYQMVIERVKQEALPVILMCDGNAVPTTRQYQWMREILDEAYHQRGWGFGFTFTGASFLPIPFWRVDYIWFSTHFTALEAKVWSSDGYSDHRPVWAKLDLHT